MPNNDYVLTPSEPPAQLETEHEEQDDLKQRPPRQASGPTVLQTNDPRFNPPSPSPLKRAALLLFVFCLFWFAVRLRTAKPRPPPALATERYSTDFDYRPAVSSERIKKTKTRFRGA